jgi:CDP-diacylglycerol--glycerol-3-phosphate 3-phosphatidyltransferase
VTAAETERPSTESWDLLTPANAITTARILVAPILLVMIVRDGPSWRTFCLGMLLAASDALDGWLARRQGPTAMGAFLDPLADKVIILGSMYALVAWGSFHWVPVALITVREVAMSMYRSVVARRGMSIPARPLAKAKTLVQGTAAGLAVMPPVAEHAPWLATTVLWFAVALTLVTGWQYLSDARRR